MPLRDHFHSPVNDKHRWDAVHGQWPAELVRTLFDLLPPGFTAEPQIYHGAPFEVDVAMIDDDDRMIADIQDGGGGTALLTAPTLTIPAHLSMLDEYEVLVYDEQRERTLVAAIEIVSPANKDRPDTRLDFITKVAALLRQDVCVVIVDMVTTTQASLYIELLHMLRRNDPSLSESPPQLYAVTLRTRKPRKSPVFLDAWYYPLTLGQPLPTISLWLSPDLRIELPLEPSYSEMCRLLRIV